MTSGEPSAWGPPTGGPPDPYAGSYAGPWGPAPGAPTGWAGPPPPWPGAPVTDEQLRRLPPPGPLPPRAGAPVVVDQRPAVIGLAVTLAVTGSLLWVCGLSLFGVVALAGIQAMSPVGDEGVVFHTLDQFVLRMGDGLWVPLYGFPVASIVTGFLLLSRRPWTRLAHSGVGVASLAWAAWWLRDSWLSWVVVALYVGLAVAVLWAPSVGRWYDGRPRRPRTPRVAPDQLYG
ncbi:hypothetical protein GCM10022197_19300 [Microlunatus spumicola]|uniref:Integral membrane protein n=1 Tax=Microlunatus spumicola TaxID=81499 RepID=A0ABP6XA66_9ACTN